jgi:hypothetical protein
VPCQVEFAVRLDLQKMSGLGEAIAFPDRRIGADSRQRRFLSRLALSWSRLLPHMSWTALPNAAYVALWALISDRRSRDSSRSWCRGSVARAAAAADEAMTALPEWKSKTRRLILDMVNSPLFKPAVPNDFPMVCILAQTAT